MSKELIFTTSIPQGGGAIAKSNVEFKTKVQTLENNSPKYGLAKKKFDSLTKLNSLFSK